MIGENLAMGNFKNSRDLVEAWMASPGHRANILKSRYEDIGISVKKGTFKGREVWVAAQHFGLSSKTCPEVDLELKKKVTDQTLTLSIESINLNSLEASVIGGFEDKSSLEYIKNVENYNQRIKAYNQEITKSKEEILEYNNQVKLFNDCIAGNTFKL